ncbi:MAG: peptidylprolyl isomerase [Thermoanaerobaculaceae bacterium]|nr:peptidylprolyl isomerase [Thermoanaerobaculaceae bacterium]
MRRGSHPCTRWPAAAVPGGYSTPCGTRRTVLVAAGGVLGLALAVGGLGCRGRSPVLAVVAQHPVTMEEVGAAVQYQTGKPLAQAREELVAAIFESYLEEEVILATSKNPEDRLVPLARRAVRTRELLEELCPPPPSPSEAEIAARLADQKPQGERVLLRQLILPDLPTAQAARRRLEAGEDFVALSRELSRAPNAAQGGAIGWVERGQLVPEFEAAIFHLREGATSQPVASNAGWHVFQVTARQAPGSAPDATTRQRVREELSSAAAEKTRRECVLRLARTVGVTVTCEGAPFPCRNPFEESS